MHAHVGAVLALLILASCGATRVVDAHPAVPVGDAALSAEFNNLSTTGDGVYFGGYPTEQGLRDLRARGVRKVISLKTPSEVREARGFDEPALARELGMEVVYIPITPDSFSRDDVKAFSREFDHSEEPVLVHCGSANTVGGLWSAYLYEKRGVAREKALELGRAAGLRPGSMSEAAERVMDEGGE